MNSNPWIASWYKGNWRDPYNSFDTEGKSVSLIKVLLPLPDTPVTTINFPIGKSIFIFFKLLPVAPLIDRKY